MRIRETLIGFSLTISIESAKCGVKYENGE